MKSKKSTFHWGLVLSCLLLLSAIGRATAQDEVETYATAGQKALSAGHYEDARSNFEQLTKLQPGIAEAHATLAVIYFKMRQFDLAVQEVRTAQKLKPTLPKLDSLLALSLSELGRFPEALPHLERGFKQNNDRDVQRMCGLQLLRAYRGLAREADAVETSLVLNRLFPDDPEVLYHTGRIYGNFAYIVMEKLHDKAPGSIWMLQAQGEANESQKNYEAAIIAFNHVLEIEPHRPGIHYRLGRVHLARFENSTRPEDRETAKSNFLAELEIDPGNGNARYELAQMAASDNDLEDAQKQFEAVLADFPDFEQALVGLGGVYLQGKAAAKAVAPLERATTLDSNDEVAWYRLAQAQRGAGNREAAQKALDTFRRLHDSSTVATKPPPVDEITPQQLGSSEQP